MHETRHRSSHQTIMKPLSHYARDYMHEQSLNTELVCDDALRVTQLKFDKTSTCSLPFRAQLIFPYRLDALSLSKDVNGVCCPLAFGESPSASTLDVLSVRKAVRCCCCPLASDESPFASTLEVLSSDAAVRSGCGVLMCVEFVCTVEPDTLSVCKVARAVRCYILCYSSGS